MPIKLGLEKLAEIHFKPLKGKNVALIANPASINQSFENTIDIFVRASQKKIFSLKKLFGPQQGIFESQQANMIEWEGSTDNPWNIPTHSLYGAIRKPTDEMLKDVDTLVFDLQDIGAKGYTFISTLYYAMEACQDTGTELMVLDRPNPLGRKTQGPVTRNAYKSFVGIHNLPLRHGLTMAETALLFKKEIFKEINMSIIKMERWKPDKFFDELKRPWIPITPNVPSFKTALVFPGMELFEGTTISEGRGTTRPFEQCGAPFIDPYKLAAEMKSKRLWGVTFRPVSFTPTFDKWKDQNCYGVFIHVTNQKKFCSARCALELIQTIRVMNPNDFSFTDPPYEYETENMPFDILVGNDYVRMDLMKGMPVKDIEAKWKPELAKYLKRIESILIYKRQ